MLYSSKVTGVFYIWYQSEVETLGPIGLKNLQQVSFYLTIEFVSVTQRKPTSSHCKPGTSSVPNKFVY